jgi:flavorubredoxin
MEDRMASSLVIKMYEYYSELESREAEDDVHVVYEDEYENLKNLYDAAFKAVSHLPADTKKQRDRIDDLLDGALADVKYFLDQLAESRKTD